MYTNDLLRFMLHSDFLKQRFHIDRVLNYQKFDDCFVLHYVTSSFITDLKPCELELYVTPILLESNDYDVHFQVVYREKGLKPFVSSSVECVKSSDVREFNNKLKSFR